MQAVARPAHMERGRKTIKKDQKLCLKAPGLTSVGELLWSVYVVYVYGIMKSCNLCLSYKKENIYRPRLGEDPSNRTCNAGTYKIVDENHCLIKIAHL